MPAIEFLVRLANVGSEVVGFLSDYYWLFLITGANCKIILNNYLIIPNNIVYLF